MSRVVHNFLDLIDAPGNWTDSALCAQTDAEVFFPEKGQNPRDGKKVCSRCPVAAECLSYALERDEHYGIWGGLSPSERRHLKTLTTPARTDEP